MNQKGTTLFELLIAIVIMIALGVAMVIPNIGLQCPYVY